MKVIFYADMYQGQKPEGIFMQNENNVGNLISGYKRYKVEVEFPDPDWMEQESIKAKVSEEVIQEREKNENPGYR